MTKLAKKVRSNETQYVDDIPWVQLRITSYLGSNYICQQIEDGAFKLLKCPFRGLNILNQLLYCVSLNIYNKFAIYFCELKFSGNTHQRP